jgi:hypothetical protein
MVFEAKLVEVWNRSKRLSINDLELIPFENVATDGSYLARR